MPQGVNRSESPTEEQDVEQDASGSQPAASESESSTETDVTSTDSSSADARGNGESRRGKSTPLDELRGKLTGTAKAADQKTKEEPETESVKEEESDESEDQVDDKHQAEKPTEDGEDGDQPAATDTEGDDQDDADENQDNPLRSLPKEKRDQVGKYLSSQLKKRTAEVIEKHPDIQAGRFLQTLRQKHGLTDDEVASSLVLSAAFNAGDPRALEVLEAHADQLRKHLKKPPRSASALAPFKGVLPQEYADMVQVLGFSEEDARLAYAAVQARQKATKVKEEVEESTDDNAEEERDDTPPMRPLRPRQTAPSHVAGFHPDDVAMADQATADLLTSKGITEEKHREHMAKLIPFLNQAAPVNPQTGKPDHRFIDPERRVKAVQIAHQRYVIAEAKRVADAKRKAGPSAAGGAPPVPARSDAASTNRTPLQQLRRRMVGRG